MIDYSKTPLGKLPWREAKKIYQTHHKGRKLRVWNGNRYLGSGSL